MPVLPSCRLLLIPLCLALLPAGIAGADRAAAEPVNPMDAIPLCATGKTDPRMAPFDELLSSFVREHKLPGAAVAVMRRGRLVYARGFGYADIDARDAVQPESLFRIASISKPVTAVAVLRLVEQAKLELDDKAFARLDRDPELMPHGTSDPRLKQVTIRQLLQHTGGWDRDVSFDPMFRAIEIAREMNAEPPAGPALVIRYMGGKPLDFDPGERFAYSNYGYCVLGRLIEKASGEPYEKYVREQVLRPLGITRMQLGRTLPEGRAEGEVKYYEPDGKPEPAVVGKNIGAEVPPPYGAWSLEAMDSHGGWIASAIDLARFAAAFDDPARCPILKAGTIAAMFERPQGLPGYNIAGNPKPTYYGLGWQVRPEGHPFSPTQWHTGSLPGTSTILVRRNDGINWAVLINTRNTSVPEKAPARILDPLLHEAADKITEWPEGEEVGIQ
jgi:N-acyl-D-amino-acid deacylase